MKSLKYLPWVVVAIIAMAATFLGDFGNLAGSVVVANLVPTGFSDPDIMRQWSRQYFLRTQAKTIFDERFTGTTMSKDGVKYSDTIVGPPVLVVTDLSSINGMTVTYTMIEPFYQTADDRLKGSEGRVKGQIREGSEKSVNKKYIKFPLASKFWGVKEEDVFVGQKEIGMADMATKMTKQLSDNVAQYMDDDCIDSFFSGYSTHLWTTIAGDGATDEQAVAGNTDLGVIGGPAEHLNSYAWVPDGGSGFKMVKAASNSTAHIATMMNQITSAAVPSAKLLDSIVAIVKTSNIVGTEYRGGKFTEGATFVKVLVDPILMAKFRQESTFRDTVNSAYQTKGDEHPLIRQGEIIWGNLHICEFNKLLEDRWSNKYSFNATGAGSTGNAKIRVTGTAGTAGRNVYVEFASRVLGGAAAADTAITSTGGDKIANIMVLGANSIGRVPGPVKKLIPRSTNDYGRIEGLGSEHIFGHKRIDFTNASNVVTLNQSSLRIAVYRGTGSEFLGT